MGRTAIDLAGQRFGRLLVAGRAGSTKGATWLCVCDCGGTKVVRSDRLRAGTTRSCGCYMNEVRGQAQRKLVVNYDAAHQRLLRAKGAASKRPCADCGRPARHWSYDGMDPHELRDRGSFYSLDPDRYVPRCNACHSEYDKDGQAKSPMPIRGIRVPDDLWAAAQTAAQNRGETLSQVVRATLKRYVARH